MRVWYAIVGTILWLGIFLTGFSTASWLLYLPAAGFIFAAITGICPSQVSVFKVFGIKIKETSGK